MEPVAILASIICIYIYIHVCVSYVYICHCMSDLRRDHGKRIDLGRQPHPTSRQQHEVLLHKGSLQCSSGNIGNPMVSQRK